VNTNATKVNTNATKVNTNTTKVNTNATKVNTNTALKYYILKQHFNAQCRCKYIG